MSGKDIGSDYKDKILCFSPTEEETSYFSKSLIYICEHSDEGTLGLIINRPLQISMTDFFKSMNIKILGSLSQDFLLMGGPVNPGAVFILHSADTEWESTMPINKDVSLSTSIDILRAIANGDGPADYLITLGYTGWVQEQLEQEILENAWLVAPSNYKVLFKMKPKDKIRGVSEVLGFDIQMVSPKPGKA
tara:strand:- start:1045 stop:1617 length:573 start_codon:yes stop_codon:yes gene_type:complete